VDDETREQPEVEDPLTGGDEAHFAATTTPEAPAKIRLIRMGVALLSIVTEAPRDWSETFDNDFSAAACFARCIRQLRAATLLTVFGYTSEVGTILRGAYESAALGRYLAHEPREAQRWLRSQTSMPGRAAWIPDREVRDWFGAASRDYAEFYRQLSAEAHPTSSSCLPLLTPDENGYTVRIESVFDAEAVDASLQKILLMTLWACFALRNAAPREEALPPPWRRALAGYAREVSPEADFSHIERDWNEEQARWEAMVEHVRSVDELATELETNPRSVQNVWRATAHNDDDSTPEVK
jgi:hypothetical protein